ncbi:MAG: heme o synthase [Bacilli bacterium]
MGNVTTTLREQSASEAGQTFSKDFLALIKIGIVNSNLITTFTGFWLALHFNGLVIGDYIVQLIAVMIGSSLVIGGSCSINNYIDRDIDHLMERTKNRPTVSGRFSGRMAISTGITLIASGLVILATTTTTAMYFAAFGSFVYVVLYSLWTKRKYSINTVVGSFSGAMPPLIGWAAVDGDLHMYAWILFLMLFVWQPPHFLALAMRRSEEYRAAGIPMLPVVHGFAITKRQILVWIICLFPLPFFMYELGMVYLVLATLLNVVWLILAFRGFRTSSDDISWSRTMFVYSINYLTLLFFMSVVVTLF